MKNDYTTHLLGDKDKAEGVFKFTKDELFDRVINLRLHAVDRRTGETEEFTIHSDWEAYYPELNRVATGSSDPTVMKNFYVRRCIHKPSIKVQYKQVSSGVAVAVDIYVSNFILLSSDGRQLMQFNNLTYSLGQVDIQMGYFGQFAKYKPQKLSDFSTCFEDNKNADLIKVMTGQGYVQTDKLPPDMVLHIHGYVGTSYNPPLSDLVDDVEVKYSPEELKKFDKEADGDSYVEDYIFLNITRRFIRSNLDIKNITKNEAFKKTGLMTKADAKQYGVKVFMSEKLKAFCKERLEVKHDIKGSKKKLVVASYSNSVVQALNVLRDDLGIDITSKALIDGNYLLFLASETKDTEALAKSLESYKLSDKDLKQAGSIIETVYSNTLPAVENITTDALCVIVCPFYFFINPFDKIKFKSRYALGGIVSYYADFTAVESEFYALYMTVSFATVDNVNECMIVCTGKKEGR